MLKIERFGKYKFLSLLFFIFLSILPSYAARKCWNCGHLNFHHDRYCSDCYTDISDVPDKAYTEEPQNKDIKLLVTQSSRNYVQTGLIALGIFIFMIVILSKIQKIIENRRWHKIYEKFKDEIKQNDERREQEFKQEQKRLENIKTPFKILNIPPDSKKEEISIAYRKLAKQFHPDQFVSASLVEKEEASRKMEEINWAYNELKRRKSV